MEQDIMKGKNGWTYLFTVAATGHKIYVNDTFTEFRSQSGKVVMKAVD